VNITTTCVNVVTYFEVYVIWCALISVLLQYQLDFSFLPASVNSKL